MRALAEQVGVSQTTINKYEKGVSMPSSSQMIKLSKSLGVKVEYFFRPMQIELKGVEYRKRSSAPKKLLAKIEADVLDQAERWTQLLSLYPKAPVPEFSLPSSLADRISCLEEIEVFADTVRETWELGLNPVPDMIDVLESMGVLVIVTSIDVAGRLDGLAASVNGTPVIVVSAQWPGDRQRFTLAHELGHLLLEGRLAQSIDEEKACDRFAGAFLLPKKSLIKCLGERRNRLESRELYLLKQEFGISMMGALIRAHQCRVIADSVKDSMFRYFSKKGWRTSEPGTPYPSEKTYMFRQLAYRALAEDYIGESKAAELIGLSTSELREERKMGGMDAAVVNQ